MTEETDRASRLLERHPRAGWAEKAGPLARYWLERHAGFRQLAGALDRATAELQAGRLSAAEFRPWFAPRLQLLLTHLDGHHEVEDYYYFPRLRAAEPGVAPLLDALAADHEALNAAIAEAVEAANALLGAASGTEGERAAGARYADASGRLFALLLRHLDAEEDLVIPLLLERGEGALGVG